MHINMQCVTPQISMRINPQSLFRAQIHTLITSAGSYYNFTIIVAKVFSPSPLLENRPAADA